MDPAAREETIDSLRVHVRRGLDRFFLGQYFTEYGLAEDTKLIPDNVNVDDYDDLEAAGLTDKHSPFQIFLKAVASEIVKEKGEVKGRKKRIREYLEVLQAFQDEWVLYIKKNMRKKVKQTSSIMSSASQQQQQQQTPTSQTSDNKDGSDKKKKKGGKRGPRGPYKKRKKKEDNAAAGGAAASSSVPSNKKTSTSTTTTSTTTGEPGPKRQKVLDLDQMRKDFEQERDSIMAQVPEHNKKMFKQVGFAKWSKNYLPAMCLSPYAVPPGDIREQWMKMFHNVKEKDRMDRMSHLVWWIGSKEDMGTYSVVARHQFIPYQEGATKGMHVIPQKMKRMLEQGKKLSKSQEEEVEGLQQLNELALLPPDDREHPRGNFEEDDFWGYDEDELVGDDEEEEEDDDGEGDDEDDVLEDDEEDLVDSDMEDMNAKPKKQKYKKRKKNDDVVIDEDEEGEEVVYDDIEEPPEKKKSKLERKKKKKKKKDQTESMDVDDPPVGDKELGEDTAEALDPSASAPVPAPVVMERVSLEEFLGDEASASGGDSALEDSDYGGDGGVDDEDLGKDVLPVAKKMKKLKKKGSKNHNSQDTGEDKPLKKKKKEKEPKEPKKRSKAAEQRDLDRCIDEYLPMIEKLKVAKEAKNIPEIQKTLQTLLPVAEKFTASFFSEYEIPKAMKSTKAVLEESEADTSTYRKLWNKMKASYTEKAKLLPEGFKPKKRTPKSKSVKVEDDEPAPKPVKEEMNASSQSSPNRDQDQAPVKIENDTQNDNTQSTPMKMPIKQEDKRRLSATSDQSVKAAAEKAAAAPPTKPKKFSVMDFMRKKKEAPRDPSANGSGADKSYSAASRGVSGKKSIPSWVTAPPPSTFDSFAGSDRREDRLFALEFLLQAAAHFPAGKGVNEESVARALEMAVYEWSESQSKSSSWSDTYWDKIHAIVAAITGKREIGSLVEAILEGQFSTPKAIVTLSDENLEHSFESRPLVLNSE